jgi:hypothetical protein
MGPKAKDNQEKTRIQGGNKRQKTRPPARQPNPFAFLLDFLSVISPISHFLWLIAQNKQIIKLFNKILIFAPTCHDDPTERILKANPQIIVSF